MIEKLEELLKAEPFHGLFIVMDSGARYEVQSPWQISMGKTLLNYFYINSDREAKLRKAAISSLEEIGVPDEKK